MKRYQSHKIVEAAQIRGFADEEQKWVYTFPQAEGVRVPDDFFARGYPSPRDYLVRYALDGYLSWSPKSVFEAGYTLIDQPAPGNTWQSRAMDELEELGKRLDGLRKALLAGTVTDPQSVAFMQDQYKAMCAYHDALELRLRYTGVIDTEAPLTVREKDGLGVVTVRAPAGMAAEVIVERTAAERQVWTVTEGQTQSWGAVAGDAVTVRLRDISTLAPKRGAE